LQTTEQPREAVEDAVRTKVIEALAKGLSYRAAAADADTSLGTVQRIAAASRPFGERGVEPVAA
jgi:transposase